jgi:hypothetical protein
MGLTQIGILIVLVVSHIVVLRIGWTMGRTGQTPFTLTSPGKEDKTPYHDPPDIYDEERLDFE